MGNSPSEQYGSDNAEAKHFLLYDFMQVAGGAERVTLTLAQALPNFQTVVSRCYAQAQPLLDGSPVSVRELRGGWSTYLPRILESMWCFRFRSQCLHDAQQVVYSGFYAPLAVYQQRGGQRIYYCHTIPRYAYDLYESTLAQFPAAVCVVCALVSQALRVGYRADGSHLGELGKCAPAP